MSNELSSDDIGLAYGWDDPSRVAIYKLEQAYRALSHLIAHYDEEAGVWRDPAAEEAYYKAEAEGYMALVAYKAAGRRVIIDHPIAWPEQADWLDAQGIAASMMPPEWDARGYFYTWVVDSHNFHYIRELGEMRFEILADYILESSTSVLFEGNSGFVLESSTGWYGVTVRDIWLHNEDFCKDKDREMNFIYQTASGLPIPAGPFASFEEAATAVKTWFADLDL